MKQPLAQHAWGIFMLLAAFRIINALMLRTFFQPDEYFQSLEPAWNLAFGPDSGAWITWEWKQRLRSSMHPILFCAVYQIASMMAKALHLSPASRANLLIAAPKVLQAHVAAAGDYFTWRLACQIYGRDHLIPKIALALTVCSPWQWFCSTRTLSNGLEMTLTVIALCDWPWSGAGLFDTAPAKKGEASLNESKAKLFRSLVVAAMACVLRPTNVLIWIPLALMLLSGLSPRGRWMFIREAFFCGSLVLGTAVLVDRVFYGTWTLTPLRFLYFNLVQSLAVFYGRNVWHYYLTQGVPLLLTTALKFGLVGLFKALLTRRPVRWAAHANHHARWQLGMVTAFTTIMLSLVAHKEVRFLYPLLPILHLFAAERLAEYLGSGSTSPRNRQTWSGMSWQKKLVLPTLLLLNVLIAAYASLVHQSGVISVMDHLRHEHEARLQEPGASARPMSVGFLMPCHSTPWRSHLVHPDIHAWALTCEPPVDVPMDQRGTYMDEADRFYANPASFLQHELRHEIVNTTSNSARGDLTAVKWWPDYLVFFEQLEPVLKKAQRAEQGRPYVECWRTFNTHGHDDGRRRGDVIVWCVQ
ncbi:MAG: ornithine aminotransferase [Watsoniomyces obsoletus]|nr:MAG: ornithine aminotransferase [Watsoniomyces obsoletus]